MKIIYSDSHYGHNPQREFLDGELKPYQETPRRAQIILDTTQAAELGPVIAPFDFGLTPILTVHTPEYVGYLQNAYTAWVADGGLRDGVYPDTFPVRKMTHRPTKPSALAGYYSSDVTAIIVEGTYEAAYGAAQCAVMAAQFAQRDGERGVFALCRPPGHHAHADLCGGYCFLNNAAIASDWLTRQTVQVNQNARKATVALLDIDFHHGNGSQAIFYSRDDVLFCSLHADPDRQYPYYTGTVSECGEGRGYRYTINYPLEKGVTDERYLAVLGDAGEQITRYSPTYLVVSLGVDTYAADPLGDFALTSAVYPRIGASLAQLNLPTVFIMEGGYAIEQLGLNVVGVLTGFDANS